MTQKQHALAPYMSFKTLIEHHRRHHEEYKTQQARIAELENAVNKSADWLKEKQERIAELEASIKYTRDLLRTSLCPDAIGLTPLEWANHRIDKAAGELTEALEKKP